MKLNPDCIRDILMTVEDLADGVGPVRYDKDEMDLPRLKNYTHKEILYHVQQCEMADLIVGYLPFDCGNSFWIKDLTPEGHEFIANIRQDNIWKNVKDISAKVGSNSLGSLMQIAVNVISEIISGTFGTS